MTRALIFTLGFTVGATIGWWIGMCGIPYVTVEDEGEWS